MNSNQTERSVKRKSMEKGVTWNLESDIIRRVPCDDLGRTRTVKSPWLVGAREIMHGIRNSIFSAVNSSGLGKHSLPAMAQCCIPSSDQRLLSVLAQCRKPSLGPSYHPDFN
ncbi:hypothetical protein PV328_007685 [Microctonus aethiopoides]|uniref:Uncharacterized protein n=1 Tax=Microctonus aethiopoides TaxID=144406 RepID=A0AA39C9P8_9HYME|nr:hypothetical protein PV328_007685 [Microctonus aethiopoides]